MPLQHGMGGIRHSADQRQDRPGARGQRPRPDPRARRIAPPDRPGKPAQPRQRFGVQPRRLDRMPAQRAQQFGLPQGRRSGWAQAQHRHSRHQGQPVALAGGTRQDRRRDRPRRPVHRQRRRHHGLLGGSVLARNLRRRGPGKARQIMWPPRLGACAGKLLTAERLTAHDRTDLVAVDVSVADFQRLDHRLNPVVNAGVQAKGQPVSRGVDRAYNLGHAARRKMGDVQHRAKDLARDVRDAPDPDHRRRDEIARRRRQFLDHPPLGPRCRNIIADPALRPGINHRPDIGRQIPRIAQRQFVHRAKQHLFHRLGDIFLHIQTAQRRTALPG